MIKQFTFKQSIEISINPDSEVMTPPRQELQGSIAKTDSVFKNFFNDSDYQKKSFGEVAMFSPCIKNLDYLSDIKSKLQSNVDLPNPKNFSYFSKKHTKMVSSSLSMNEQKFEVSEMVKPVEGSEISCIDNSENNNDQSLTQLYSEVKPGILDGSPFKLYETNTNGFINKSSVKKVNIYPETTESNLLTNMITDKIEKFSKISDDNLPSNTEIFNKISNFSLVQKNRRSSESPNEINLTAMFNNSFNQIILENGKLKEEVFECKNSISVLQDQIKDLQAEVKNVSESNKVIMKKKSNTLQIIKLDDQNILSKNSIKKNKVVPVYVMKFQ